MNVKVPRGRYVLAVSGGVDSMVLLDLLRQKPVLELIVAHFNHGIRADSAIDEQLVATIAKKDNLPLVIGKGNLGSESSEKEAREARYAFLDEAKEKYKAKAIITAHHQDDLIETAILNILRGTGRRGITAIANNPKIVRPLLDVPKKSILEYATQRKLVWHEDKTNEDLKYLRNYVRKHITGQLTSAQRQIFIKNIDIVAKNNKYLEQIIATLSQSVINKDLINRQKFLLLPHEVGNELIMYWLRQRGIRQFDKKIISKINMALRTAQPQTKVPINKKVTLVVERQIAYIESF